MTKRKALKTFSIWAKCYREVSIDIQAESLEEALAKSKEIDEDEFVTVNGDYHDGSTEIYGIFQS